MKAIDGDASANARVYSSEQWRKNYRVGEVPEPDTPPVTLPDLFMSARKVDGDASAILYFDCSLSFRELDEMSDALAAFLAEHGFSAGNHLALFLQNMPQFVIAVLAASKLGGVVVPINPMNQEREVNAILVDCRPHTLICLDSLNDIISRIEQVRQKEICVITTSAKFLQDVPDPRILPETTSQLKPLHWADFSEIIQARSVLRSRTNVLPGDLAFLLYTSGTTGVPKAAMLTHGNVTGNARSMAAWFDLKHPVGPILGMAPLFHVTGLVAHMVLAWALPAPVILMFRFEPSVVIEAIRAHRPAFTVGTITAYMALLQHPSTPVDVFGSFHALVSGGAPVAPSVIKEILERTGSYVHNGYGLTETSAGVICVPFGATAPVEPVSGALSIGVPTFGVHAWIADDDGHPVPVGETGEIVISGPSVASGYWNRPEESFTSMRSDGFRTGDIGFMNADGWFFLIDRKKDMINASGFKVWPREVEDVLMSHEAVSEAAVIGIADAYRTETVCAVLSLIPGISLDVDDIKAWCRMRLAAYKRPREYLVLDTLPKTVTGKVLKRELREIVAKQKRTSG